jgi:hypothetical protein
VSRTPKFISPLLSVVASVFAGASPIRTTYAIDFTGLSPVLTSACGFPVARHATGTLAMLVWLDAQGQPEKVTYTFPAAKLELSANGRSLTASVAGPGFETYSADGTLNLVSTGTIHFMPVPGSGPGLGFAGRMVETYDGNGEIIDSDFSGASSDVAAACAYFAP